MPEKFAFLQRQKNAEIDRSYFAKENVLSFALFAIAGISLFIPEGSDVSADMCRGSGAVFPFLQQRINGLNNSVTFLGCRFAIEAVLFWVTDILFLSYAFFVFLKHLKFDVFSVTRDAVSVTVVTSVFLMVFYFTYLWHLTILDPQYPGGMGFMNSSGVLFLHAGLNLLMVIALANLLAFTIKLRYWREHLTK